MLPSRLLVPALIGVVALLPAQAAAPDVRAGRAELPSVAPNANVQGGNAPHRNMWGIPRV